MSSIPLYTFLLTSWSQNTKNRVYKDFLTRKNNTSIRTGFIWRCCMFHKLKGVLWYFIHTVHINKFPIRPLWAALCLLRSCARGLWVLSILSVPRIMVFCTEISDIVLTFVSVTLLVWGSQLLLSSFNFWHFFELLVSLLPDVHIYHYWLLLLSVDVHVVTSYLSGPGSPTLTLEPGADISADIL